MKILIIEDNPRLSRNIQTLLRHEGYAVDQAHNASIGLEKSANEPYDLVIIDRMLPDGDGIQVCKTIRAESPGTCLMMLTAKSQIEDKVEGLNYGADDYVTKPFDAPELLARIRALLRRSERTARTPEISFGKLVIDTNSHSARWNGKDLVLTAREYALLEYMAINRDTALSRDNLLSHVWDENADPFSNTVDVHVAFIRSKLKENNVDSITIKTIKGVGYMLIKS